MSVVSGNGSATQATCLSPEHKSQTQIGSPGTRLIVQATLHHIPLLEPHTWPALEPLSNTQHPANQSAAAPSVLVCSCLQHHTFIHDQPHHNCCISQHNLKQSSTHHVRFQNIHQEHNENQRFQTYSLHTQYFSFNWLNT